MRADDAATIVRALSDVLGPVSPAMAALWLACAFALALILVLGWERVFRQQP